MSDEPSFQYPGPPPLSLMHLLQPALEAMTREFGAEAARNQIKLDHADFEMIVGHFMAATVCGAHIALKHQASLMRDDRVPAWITPPPPCAQ